MEKAYKWIPALFILKLVVVIWVESTVSSWHWKGNVLIGALPYILLGHYIAKKKEYFAKWNNQVLIGCIILSALFILWSVKGTHSLNLSQIGVLIYANAIFLLATNNPDLSISKKIGVIGNRYSLYIYIFHRVIGNVIMFVARRMGIEELVWGQWCVSLVTIAASIIFSMLLCKALEYLTHLKNRSLE